MTELPDPGATEAIALEAWQALRDARREIADLRRALDESENRTIDLCHRLLNRVSEVDRLRRERYNLFRMAIWGEYGTIESNVEAVTQVMTNPNYQCSSEINQVCTATLAEHDRKTSEKK